MEQENSLIPEEEIKNPEILETSTNDEPVVAESKAVENAKEKKEVPEIDVSILSTEEIIRQGQKLINDYPVVSLKEIFEELTNYDFIWIDRGTICNLAFVECVHNGAIIMKNGDKFWISRGKIKYFKQLVQKYWDDR